jgi:hypothetical protein
MINAVEKKTSKIEQSIGWVHGSISSVTRPVLCVLGSVTNENNSGTWVDTKL